jgi:hypothetical protein
MDSEFQIALIRFIRVIRGSGQNSCVPAFLIEGFGPEPSWIPGFQIESCLSESV